MMAECQSMQGSVLRHLCKHIQAERIMIRIIEGTRQGALGSGSQRKFLEPESRRSYATPGLIDDFKVYFSFKWLSQEPSLNTFPP